MYYRAYRWCVRSWFISRHSTRTIWSVTTCSLPASASPSWTPCVGDSVMRWDEGSQQISSISRTTSATPWPLPWPPVASWHRRTVGEQLPLFLLNFGLLKNFFLVGIFSFIWSQKPSPFGGKFGDKIEISSTRNLFRRKATAELTVGISSGICSVCGKIATFCSAHFLTRRRRWRSGQCHIHHVASCLKRMPAPPPLHSYFPHRWRVCQYRRKTPRGILGVG